MGKYLEADDVGIRVYFKDRRNNRILQENENDLEEGKQIKLLIKKNHISQQG